MRTSLTVDEVCELRKRQAVVLLDVREKEEYAGASIDGSILVPLGTLEVELPNLELPKDKEVICICRSGGRSAIAAEFLRQQGFQGINMEGGMIQWIMHKHTEGEINDEEYKRIMEFFRS